MTEGRQMLVACLSCGDSDHAREGAEVAAWHLAHACEDEPDVLPPQEAPATTLGASPAANGPSSKIEKEET